MTCERDLELRAAYNELFAERVDTDSLDEMIDWCERFEEIDAQYKRHRYKCEVCRSARVFGYASFVETTEV